jgi:hypothetical protein
MTASPKVTALNYRRKVIPCKLHREDKGTHAIWRITPPAGYLRPNPVIETPKGREVLVLIDPAPIEFDGAHVAALMRAEADHFGIALGDVVDVREDRVYFTCDRSLRVRLGRRENYRGPKRFSRDKSGGKLHAPPEIYITTNTEGYERPTWRVPYELVGSWRSGATPSLQVTIWKPPGDRITVAELDIDYKRGLGHVVKEVIPNAVLRRKTDPIIAAQLCAWFWEGFELPFTIEPGA